MGRRHGIGTAKVGERTRDPAHTVVATGRELEARDGLNHEPSAVWTELAMLSELGVLEVGVRGDTARAIPVCLPLPCPFDTTTDVV